MTEIDFADVNYGCQAGQQADQHSYPEYSAAVQCTAIAPRARRRWAPCSPPATSLTLSPGSFLTSGSSEPRSACGLLG
jgi:hypothetical protein